jgi:hypothetical protein
MAPEVRMLTIRRLTEGFMNTVSQTPATELIAPSVVFHLLAMPEPWRAVHVGGNSANRCGADILTRANVPGI